MEGQIKAGVYAEYEFNVGSCRRPVLFSSLSDDSISEE